MIIPLSLFVVFILPFWLWLHYHHQKRAGGQLTQQEIERLTRLADSASEMRQRILALEAILDAQHPHWRETP